MSFLDRLTKSNNVAKEGINYIRNLSWSTLLNELYSFDPQDESAVFARDSINKYALTCFPNSGENWYNDVKANVIADSNLSEYKKRELIEKIDAFKQYSDALECWNDANILVRGLNEINTNPSISAIADKVLMNPDKYKENLFAFGDDGEAVWAEIEESFGLMDRALNGNNFQQVNDNSAVAQQQFEQVQNNQENNYFNNQNNTNYNSYINSENLSASANTSVNVNNNYQDVEKAPNMPKPAVFEENKIESNQNSYSNETISVDNKNINSFNQNREYYSNNQQKNSINNQNNYQNIQQYYPVNKVERNNIVENLKSSDFSWDNNDDGYSPEAFGRKDNYFDNMQNPPPVPQPAVKEEVKENINDDNKIYNDMNYQIQNDNSYSVNQEIQNNYNNTEIQNQNYNSVNNFVEENIDEVQNSDVNQNDTLNNNYQDVVVENQVINNQNQAQFNNQNQTYENNDIQNNNIEQQNIIEKPLNQKSVIISKFDNTVSYLDKSDDILNLVCVEQGIPREKHSAYSLIVDLQKLAIKYGNEILQNWNKHQDYFAQKGIDKQAFANLINEYMHDAQKQEMALNSHSVGGYFETIAEEKKIYNENKSAKQNDVKEQIVNKQSVVKENKNTSVDEFVKSTKHVYQYQPQPTQNLDRQDISKFDGIDIGMMMEGNRNIQPKTNAKYKQNIKETVSNLVKSIIDNENKQKPKIKQMVEVDKFENIKKQIEKNSAKFNSNTKNNDEIKRGRGRPRKEEIHQARNNINNEMSNLSINELQNIMEIVKQIKKEKVA